jgi:hypothetical protein
MALDPEPYVRPAGASGTALPATSHNFYEIPGYLEGGTALIPATRSRPRAQASPITWNEVTLAPERDARAAISVGERRQSRRDAAGHRNAYASMDAGEDHILGARGECAYSQLSGRLWTGADQDIGQDNDVDGVQVRTAAPTPTTSTSGRRTRPTVVGAMTGIGPAFVYQGKMYETAKHGEFFTEARPQGFLGRRATSSPNADWRRSYEGERPGFEASRRRAAWTGRS